MFWAGEAFTVVLGKILVSYSRFFSSPGLTPHRKSDLKLLRQSSRYNKSSLAEPDPVVGDRLLAIAHYAQAAAIEMAGSKNNTATNPISDKRHNWRQMS